MLAPFVLTSRLLPLLLNADAPRVITTSSISQSYRLDFDNLNQEKGYSAVGWAINTTRARTSTWHSRNTRQPHHHPHHPHHPALGLQPFETGRPLLHNRVREAIPRSALYHDGPGYCEHEDAPGRVGRVRYSRERR